MNLVLAVGAAFSVFCLTAWVCCRRKQLAASNGRRQQSGNTRERGWCHNMLIFRPVAMACALLLVSLLSLVHWGVLYPSQYTCPGTMWGSGIYHEEASAALLCVSLLILAGLLLPSVEYGVLQRYSMGSLEDAQGEHEPEVGRCCCRRWHLGVSFVLLFLMLCLPIVGLDFALAIMEYLLARQHVVLHNGMPLIVACSSVFKALMNGWLLPAAAIGCLGEPKRTVAPGKPTPPGRSRCLCCRCDFTASSLIGMAQLLTSVVLPLGISLTSLARCTGTTASASEVSGVLTTQSVSSYELDPCAGLTDCSLPPYKSPDDEVTTGQIVIRPSCASAGYQLFAPQATLVLALQAVQVLLLALVQWRSGLTLNEMLFGMTKAGMRYMQRLCACCMCYSAREPAQTKPLFYNGGPVQGAPGAHGWPTYQGGPMQTSVEESAGSVQSAAHGAPNVAPGDGPLGQIQSHTSDSMHEADAAGALKNGKEGHSAEAAAPHASPAASPLAHEDSPQAPGDQHLNHPPFAQAPNSVQSASATGPGLTTLPSTASQSQPQAASLDPETDPSQDAEEHPSPTFDSFQLHFALLTGAVFGAVYPAANAACASVLGAYALSWWLAPHAQKGDVAVPVWLRSVSLLLYSASVWFVYGPLGLLWENETQTLGTLIALVIVGLVTVVAAVYVLLPQAAQEKCELVALAYAQRCLPSRLVACLSTPLDDEHGDVQITATNKAAAAGSRAAPEEDLVAPLLAAEVLPEKPTSDGGS